METTFLTESSSPVLTCSEKMRLPSSIVAIETFISIHPLRSWLEEKEDNAKVGNSMAHLLGGGGAAQGLPRPSRV